MGERCVLPDWAHEAISEACTSSSWDLLIREICFNVKRTTKPHGKHFSEYSEAEQAILVEQEMKNVL